MRRKRCRVRGAQAAIVALQAAELAVLEDWVALAPREVPGAQQKAGV